MQTHLVTRVFIDSSVFIAASISVRGSARDLLIRGVRRELELIVSSLVLEETRRNITRKVPRALPSFEILLQTIGAEVIDPSSELVVRCEGIVHPKDAPIVAASVAASANFLASFDRQHLLTEADAVWNHFGVKLVTPDQLP
jgi:predicted nucleic acid-binding protein